MLLYVIFNNIFYLLYIYNVLQNVTIFFGREVSPLGTPETSKAETPRGQIIVDKIYGILNK